jgi:hypothetical protein
MILFIYLFIFLSPQGEKTRKQFIYYNNIMIAKKKKDLVIWASLCLPLATYFAVAAAA